MRRKTNTEFARKTSAITQSSARRIENNTSSICLRLLKNSSLNAIQFIWLCSTWIVFWSTLPAQKNNGRKSLIIARLPSSSPWNINKSIPLNFMNGPSTENKWSKPRHKSWQFLASNWPTPPSSTTCNGSNQNSQSWTSSIAEWPMWWQMCAYSMRQCSMLSQVKLLMWFWILSSRTLRWKTAMKNWRWVWSGCWKDVRSIPSGCWGMLLIRFEWVDWFCWFCI